MASPIGRGAEIAIEVHEDGARDVSSEISLVPIVGIVELPPDVEEMDPVEVGRQGADVYQGLSHGFISAVLGYMRLFSPDGSRTAVIKDNIRLVAWGVSWLVACLTVFLVAFAALPDPVAIHWNPAGVADGSAPLWMVPVSAVALLLLGFALTPVFSVGREPSMEAFALIGMSGGLATAVVGVTTSANHGLADWAQADEIGLVAIFVLFGLPALGLVGGIILGRHWYPIKTIPRRIGLDDVIDVEPGERVSWVGRARVKGVALMTFTVAVLLLFALPELPLWVFVLTAGVGVVFSQVEAHVTNDGVRVRLGGIPVRRFPLREISSAVTIDVDPAGFGGRGWKALPDKTALILRSGEALALTFSDGHQFVITVDDAPTGSALLNGLIENADVE